MTHDRDWIAAHIPHQGDMCLLEGVLSVDEQRIDIACVLLHIVDAIRLQDLQPVVARRQLEGFAERDRVRVDLDGRKVRIGQLTMAELEQ